MAPDSKIYLTRHAQAEHNVDEDWSIPDAPLTALGRKQADSVRTRIPDLQATVDLVVTSPLKRTLQTTLLTWGPAVERLGIGNVVCLPEAQECNDLPCDTGSSREVLEQDPEFDGFDLSRLSPDWTSKKGVWAADPASLATRAQAVRQFLLRRPEKHIVLVAHGDILRRITQDPYYMWKNAEIRIFSFGPDSVSTERCPLKFDKAVDSAKGYSPTSTEMDVDHEANGKL